MTKPNKYKLGKTVWEYKKTDVIYGKLYAWNGYTISGQELLDMGAVEVKEDWDQTIKIAEQLKRSQDERDSKLHESVGFKQDEELEEWKNPVDYVYAANDQKLRRIIIEMMVKDNKLTRAVKQLKMERKR